MKLGKQENDLQSRVNISTIRNVNDDGFTSTLIIYNLTEMDEGYYTCRTTDQHEKISSRLYIFVASKYLHYKLHYNLYSG